LETELKRKAEINELENISFFGYKSGNELMSILSGATCIIVPSLWYEAFGLVITEAFAAGKPVIGSDIGAIPELIEEGVDGFIFPPGDVVTLAEKITWIWNNRAAAKEMGLEGRKKVEEHYSAEAHYDGLISIYNSVLGL
jgi:glycosyltransferase involved in cell wall biosynthesis